MKAKKALPKERDPYWRERRALGHRVIRDRKKYTRKGRRTSDGPSSLTRTLIQHARATLRA